MTNQNWDPWTYRDTKRWADGSADDQLTPDELSSDVAGGMGSGTADPSLTGGSAIGGGRELTGFAVQATDGHIGKVDRDTLEVAGSYLVVDTGPWIFGRKVLLPAGTVASVDWADERVHVDLTKQEIKDSPELTDADFDDAANRDRVADYYSSRHDGPLP